MITMGLLYEPLIRYAGSAAETSIGSKPIGSELRGQFYSATPVWRETEVLL